MGTWCNGSTPRSHRGNEGSTPFVSSLRSLFRRMRTAVAKSLRDEARLIPCVEFQRTTPWQASSMKFYYVYILHSLTNPQRYYVGMTEDLDDRLKKHNAGQCKHTLKFTPWRIEIAIAFRLKDKATAFERYLKSHSGRAFAKRHF